MLTTANSKVLWFNFYGWDLDKFGLDKLVSYNKKLLKEEKPNIRFPPTVKYIRPHPIEFFANF